MQYEAVAIYVRAELQEFDNLSSMNFIANPYSRIQKVIIKTLRSTESMINFKVTYPRPREFATLSNIDTTVEEPIVPLPADVMVNETLGSRSRAVLEPRTIISTNIIGRAARNILTKGILKINVIDFSNRLSLQVRIPNINTGKNIKKRCSIMLKLLEINKNPRNTREE
jgi:hypothetical protein